MRYRKCKREYKSKTRSRLPLTVRSITPVDTPTLCTSTIRACPAIGGWNASRWRRRRVCRAHGFVCAHHSSLATIRAGRGLGFVQHNNDLEARFGDAVRREPTTTAEQTAASRLGAPCRKSISGPSQGRERNAGTGWLGWPNLV